MSLPIQTITSRENPDFRFWLRLAQSRVGRTDVDLVLLEGPHLCEAWCEHNGPPQALVVGESMQANSRVRDLWETCAASRRIILHDALARLLSQVEHGPAVFCVVAPPQPILPDRITHACLWLDRVQDPGNLGTLLRTAAAAGTRRAMLSPGCAQAWSPKVLRSGQGAHFALQIHEHADLASLVARLDVPLAVTTLDRARPLYDVDLRRPCVWLFGNEGQGVAPDLLACATTRIRIPQERTVESLNVAAAAAVCLFEQRRQQIIRGS